MAAENAIRVVKPEDCVLFETVAVVVAVATLLSQNLLVDFADTSFRFRNGSGECGGGDDDTLARTCVLQGIYSTIVMSYHFLLPQISTCRLCKLELPEPWLEKRSCSVTSEGVAIVVVAVVVVVVVVVVVQYWQQQ